MSSPFGFGFGMRYVLDAYQNFTQLGTPVYLRVQNESSVLPSDEYLDLGFEVTVTGAMVSGGGTKDIQIQPTPSVESMNTHRPGQTANYSQLQVGPTKFVISHTWVIARMKEMGYKDPMRVFRDPSVVGIMYDGDLQTIESITPQRGGGETLYWEVVTQAQQALSDDNTSTPVST